MMSEAGRELQHEMNTLHFNQHDPSRPWVIVAKDLDEGSAALWHEHSRYATRIEAREVLSRLRYSPDIDEDFDDLVMYRVVEDK